MLSSYLNKSRTERNVLEDDEYNTGSDDEDAQSSDVLTQVVDTDCINIESLADTTNTENAAEDVIDNDNTGAVTYQDSEDNTIEHVSDCSADVDNSNENAIEPAVDVVADETTDDDDTNENAIEPATDVVADETVDDDDTNEQVTEKENTMVELTSTHEKDVTRSPKEIPYKKSIVEPESDYSDKNDDSDTESFEINTDDIEQKLYLSDEEYPIMTDNKPLNLATLNKGNDEDENVEFRYVHIDGKQVYKNVDDVKNSDGTFDNSVKAIRIT